MARLVKWKVVSLIVRLAIKQGSPTSISTDIATGC